MQCYDLYFYAVLSMIIAFFLGYFVGYYSLINKKLGEIINEIKK